MKMAEQRLKELIKEVHKEIYKEQKSKKLNEDRVGFTDKDKVVYASVDNVLSDIFQFIEKNIMAIAKKQFDNKIPAKQIVQMLKQCQSNIQEWSKQLQSLGK